MTNKENIIGFVKKSRGIMPSGEIEIMENGTYDVTEKASAVVNIASRLIELKQSHIKSVEIEVS